MQLEGVKIYLVWSSLIVVPRIERSIIIGFEKSDNLTNSLPSFLPQAKDIEVYLYISSFELKTL